MSRRAYTGSRGRAGHPLLRISVVGTGDALAARKYPSLRPQQTASPSQPEPTETVAAAVAQAREHRRTTTSVGTVLALRSVTLRNELAGTVRHVRLIPGQIVNAGALLVAFDVSVEQ